LHSHINLGIIKPLQNQLCNNSLLCFASALIAVFLPITPKKVRKLTSSIAARQVLDGLFGFGYLMLLVFFFSYSELFPRGLCFASCLLNLAYGEVLAPACLQRRLGNF